MYLCTRIWEVYYECGNSLCFNLYYFAIATADMSIGDLSWCNSFSLGSNADICF